MLSQTAMRKVFWAGAAFNATAALMLVFPATLGAIVRLPSAGSPLYPWMLAYFIALLGVAYAWLALQPTFSRPLVWLGAIGKIGVFCIALACFLRGDIPFATFSVTLGDLAFGIVFVSWLLGT